MQGPAVASNWISVANHGEQVRIAFMEKHTPESPEHFRTAVMLSRSDAISLQQLLGQILDPKIQH